MVSIQETLRNLESGLVLSRFYLKKRPVRLTFQVCLETRQLAWMRNVTQCQTKPEGAIDLRVVKEVRVSRDIKEFDKWPMEADRHAHLCFSIHYGSEFVLKHLALQAERVEELNLLVQGLEYLIETTQKASFLIRIERWLRKEFYEIQNRSDTVSFADVKKWLNKSYVKINGNKLREHYTKAGVGDELIGFDQFAAVYNDIVYSKTLFRDYFGAYGAEVQGQSLPIVTADHLAEFLAAENHDDIGHDLSAVSRKMNMLLDDPVRAATGVQFTAPEFLSYLFSSENSLWDPHALTVYQDMNQPLSHYWIASSHNTYLTGDQFKSDSSIEAYIQCLRMGARCIELDCWDGPDGMPQIYHGMTLTSRIKFVDVVRTIKKYAWEFSEYPVILSIENHCSLPQQKKMAEVFLDIFGADLLIAPVAKTADRLPSPERLRRKFILKHKKLAGEEDNWKFHKTEDDSMDFSDITQSKKNGILYLQDPMNDQEWNPHFFVLTDKSLCYTEQTDLNNEAEEDEDDQLNGNLDDIQRLSNEPWFHPGLSRPAADALLAQHSNLGPGRFLVRPSEMFVGNYTLIFWQNDKSNHCRIKSKLENGQTKYYLVDNVAFDCVTDLIAYYKHNRLRAQNFEMTLTEPVPKPLSHEGKEWYSPVSREVAEDWLSRIVKDGAFVIRKRGAQNNGTDLAISFRAENKIKHSRIFMENGSYVIGSAPFDSLVELVQYYQKHPLYRKMKLRYPVNQEVVDRCGLADPDIGAIYGGIYTQPNEVTPKNQCRALYDYKEQRSDELSFSKNDVISNVIQNAADWWQGDCNGKTQGWFPRNYVEIIEDGLGSLQQGSINISKSIQCRAVGPLLASVSDQMYNKQLYIFELQHPGGNTRIAATKEDDMNDWISKITQGTKQMLNKEKTLNEVQRKFQIAREFSDLIIYCRSTPYNPDVSGSYYEMTSFSEAKAEKVCTKKDNKGKQFLMFNSVQISRIYPKGQRIDSSNFDPVLMWNCSSHMLALNYQTPDRSMQINQGRFMQNGLCGYVLKPPCLLDSDYDPFDKRSLKGVEPMTLSIVVLAGRHLLKTGRGIPSPFVEVEILGAYYEDPKKFKTKKQNNGLMVIWNEATDFDIVNPDLAMIRFCVQDEDAFGDPNFIGHATIPVRCVRSGYRSVPLLNDYSQELELSSLLVKIDIVYPNQDKEFGEIYTTIQDLRDARLSIQEKISEADANTQDRYRKELSSLDRLIEEQLDNRRKRVHMSVRNSRIRH